MSHPTHTPKRKGWALLGPKIALAGLFVAAFLAGMGAERQRWQEKMKDAPKECTEKMKVVGLFDGEFVIDMKEK